MSTPEATTFRPVRLRRATRDDARSVWRWRNEPAARAASFSSDEVPWEVHKRWFAARVDSSATHIWIAAEPSGQEIGYVRFDLDGCEAEVSVALDPSQRGRGLGRSVIRAACVREMQECALRRVRARIKSGNEASLIAFRSAGFVSADVVPDPVTHAWTLYFDGAVARAE